MPSITRSAWPSSTAQPSSWSVPFRPIAPAERLVVDGERATREQLAVIAPVDDLVDVAERDVLRRDPGVDEDADLLEGARAGLAVGVDGHAGPNVGRGGGTEDRQVAGRGPALAAGDLDDPGSHRRSTDDRTRVVVGVDPVGDVGDEEVGELVLGGPQAPVRWTVEPLVMEPGRGDDVHAAPGATARPASTGCGRSPPASRRWRVRARRRGHPRARGPGGRRRRGGSPATARRAARRR